MLCSRGVTKTILLKSPDTDRVREVIVTSVLLPKSENENNRTLGLLKSESNCDNPSLVMEQRTCKRRLDHLTLEEKILRKKLKNREAAQTSRDRKKARLEELEISVVELQNENVSLHEEVRSLKDERDTLLKENARLTEEEPKPSKESLVGQTTESMEPCWASFLNPDCNMDLDTNMEDKVICLKKPLAEKKTSPKFPKLDIKLAQNFSENILETPEIEMPVFPLDVLKITKSEELLKTSVGFMKNESITNTGNSDNKFFDLKVDANDSLLMDGMDCVVNEEVVETTVYVESSDTCVPTILLTEPNTVDLTSDDEGMFCPTLLKPKDVLEESSSDYGYESYDSPISEPEELVNLFPELW